MYAPMNLTLSTDVKFLKGVGPQRAAAMAARGIATVGDLLNHLPFRYEDRIRFSTIAEIVPGNTYTIQGTVADCGLARFARGRGAIFHLLLQDATGSLALKFFHGGYLQNRFRIGQRLVVHGKADVDPRRPGRIEMVNPPYELLGVGPEDSTEVGRIVPIYEAIGAVSSRILRRMTHAALENLGEFPHD